MEEIARNHVAPATKSYINKNIIRAIGAFFLVTIAGFLVYSLVQFYAADQTAAPDNNSSGLISKYGHAIQHRVDSVNWSGIFNNTYTNIFVMVNMIPRTDAAGHVPDPQGSGRASGRQQAS